MPAGGETEPVEVVRRGRHETSFADVLERVSSRVRSFAGPADSDRSERHVLAALTTGRHSNPYQPSEHSTPGHLDDGGAPWAQASLAWQR
ncbi:hypothetical protein FRACA_20150 [Frankia canadensis]|uniref:Uncharacterized protein n=1 Tax=Frankia canadensis TaxID=1836972 RepID=A0A2I2KQ18_9ACTN|nr:hypothetical protein FRACA_20150 [Frankia canadensis]SOU55044.1 hypothetical protein FRACA_20150 [Frankia canadensis]